jgi:phage-related protein
MEKRDDWSTIIFYFQKKSQKTPFREIQLALKIKREYENEK